MSCISLVWCSSQQQGWCVAKMDSPIIQRSKVFLFILWVFVQRIITRASETWHDTCDFYLVIWYDCIHCIPPSEISTVYQPLSNIRHHVVVWLFFLVTGIVLTVKMLNETPDTGAWVSYTRDTVKPAAGYWQLRPDEGCVDVSHFVSASEIMITTQQPGAVMHGMAHGSDNN